MTWTIKSVTETVVDAVASLDVQKGVRHNHATISRRQEIWGISIFSVAFLMWGLAYGLLDIMNYHIKVVMSISRREAAYLAMAYYFAYFVGAPIIGGPIVKRAGYRLALVAGFVLLATGNELMSVGAEKLQFPMMCFAHFVVGSGVSTLERGANAYATNCGHRSRAVLRILFAQTWAGIGTIIAPALANAVIFDPTKSTSPPNRDPLHAGRCLMPSLSTDGVDLSSVVTFYRYLGVGVYVLALAFAVLLFRTNLVVEVEVPRSPDLEHSKWLFWKHPLVSLKHARLWYGVVANFFNLGCQVAVAQFFIEHMVVNACNSSKKGASNMMYAQILFVVGRLAAAGFVMLPSFTGSKVVSRLFKSRYVLCAFLAGAVAFTAAGTHASGTAAVVCAIFVMFCEAPSFPMIFEMSTAGEAAWMPTAETIVILSISGGGLLPLLMGILTDHVGVSMGWSLVAACFGITFSYTLSCNLIPSFRNAIDAAHGDKTAGKDADVETAVVSTK